MERDGGDLAALRRAPNSWRSTRTDRQEVADEEQCLELEICRNNDSLEWGSVDRCSCGFEGWKSAV